MDQPGATGRWVLAAAILGSSMAFIDGTVVNIALPALQSSFHASGADLQWVVEAYALFLAALLLAGGSSGDIYGRRKMFLFGVVIFAGASAWCGVANTIHALIAARGLQGVGAALLVPGSLALISASFPEGSRGKAIGTWSGFSAMTAAIGPLLGGWLVQHASWRWVFYLNVPIALAVLLISMAKIPEPPVANEGRRLDWLGALLATLGLGAVTFALIESSRGRSGVLAVGLAGALLLIAFLVAESRSAHPMVPLRLFRSANFSGANMMTLFLYAALGGLLYYLPLNLIQIQHYSPTAAGAALLPFVLLMFLLSRWSGGLVAHYGERRPLIAGPMIVAAGFGLLILPGVGGSYWTTYFPGILVLGLGLAVSVAPLTTVVMNAVPQESAGTASGVNNAVSRAASLLALAFFGMAFAPVFNRALIANLHRSALPGDVQSRIFAQRDKLGAIPADTPAASAVVGSAFVHGFRLVAITGCGFSLLAATAAGLSIRTSEAGNQQLRG